MRVQKNTENNKDQFHENGTEWPTVILFLIVYTLWVALTLFHNLIPVSLVLVMLTLLVALHSSLQHEVIHGHPTRWPLLNTIMAFPALGLAVPYERYELLHLQHHRNWLLTDPYEDSESYFVPRKNWLAFNRLTKALLEFNNTLLGRLLIGPVIMLVRQLVAEYEPIKTNPEVRKSWCFHLFSAALVIAWLVSVGFPVWMYLLLVAYPAISLLMLRAFSEHLPEEDIDSRSAIIKSNWFMQLLYLNNNYHRVHHDHPELAWYRLPEMYRARYKEQTDHVYEGYIDLFKRYGFRKRFNVEHPFLARD